MRVGARFTKVLAWIAAVALMFAALATTASLAAAQGITLAQSPPTSASTDVAGSSTFATTLAVTGAVGLVTYVEAGAPQASQLDLDGTTGQITTMGTLPTGSYTISGTDSDTDSDTGSWTFTLTVNPDIITQTSTGAVTITTAQSTTFSPSPITTTGNVGAVTFVTTTSSSALSVSTGGVITTTGALSATTYTVSGTDGDSDGDTGIWTYSLTVNTDAITQTSLFTATTTTSASGTFVPGTITTSGNVGAVTFVTTTSSSALHVSSGGDITTTGALSAGVYTVSGTDSDTDGDTGTWTFALTVNAGSITQASGTSGSTTATASSTFAPGTIATSGNVGTVTFVTTTSSPALSVSSSGVITTTGALSAGVYTVSGTDHDSNGDTGAWSYSLTVTGAITQSSLLTASTTTSASATFIPGTITTSGNVGAVTFVTTTSSPALNVSSSGVITTTGALSAGVYTVSGTDHDSNGDTGAWSYSLTVTTSSGGGGSGAPSPSSGALTQTSPPTATISASDSSVYQSSDLTVSGAVGTVSFVATSTADGLVLKDGIISTSGPLAVGRYTISGTDSDTHGDVGTWTFTLTVSGGLITQSSPLSATTSVANSSAFHPGTIAVKNSTGAVTFVTTSPSTALKVSSTGVIATTRTLRIGTYTISGTDSDMNDDTGTWTFTLFVVGTTERVTFLPNGGRGTMAVERSKSPKALSPNRFTRTGYSFSHWSTRANGTGAIYGDGDVYSFTSSLTLYAQWKRGVSPTRSVFFSPNGGFGAMSAERANRPSALSLNSFIRPGYTFAHWSTSADGGGAIYANGAVYSFSASTTLYAQWNRHRAATHTVTFAANDGVGVMTPESGTGPKSLKPNRFTRHGYTFLNWSTTPRGRGAVYNNDAVYSFTSSTTLYAQWKKIVVPTPVDATAVISSFSVKSSDLTPSLESQIAALAREVKTDHDTRVTLTGFGDMLSKTDELNETLWYANYTLSERRASAVASYLRAKLAALGLTSVTVTSVGSGSPVPGTVTSTKYALVDADLT